MSSLRASALSLVLVLSACGGSDGGGPTEPTTPQVASVTVAPLTSALEPGETVQLSAQAFSSSGAIVQGRSFTWSSNATQIATVSSSGLVTALAAGTAAITATTGGVAGSATVTVEDAAVECTNPQNVALSAGQSASYDATSCLILPAGSSGDRYRVAIFRDQENFNGADVLDAELRVTALGSLQGAPPAVAAAVRGDVAPIPGLTAATLERALRVADATGRAHEEVWARAARAVEGAGPLELAPFRRPGVLPRLLAASPDTIQVDTGRQQCSSPSAKVKAVLIHENDDIAIYQEVSQRSSKPVSEFQAQRMATYYTAHGEAMVERYFGELPDVDGNGKIVLMASAEVEEVGPSVAAFIWPLDFYSTASCASSNQMELVYFNADLIRAMSDAQNPNFQALETVVHEAVHLSSVYRRIAASPTNGTELFHPAWIEEGRAEVGGNMSSRLAWAATGGPAVGAPVVRDHFVQSGVTEENYGVLLRMARTIWYLSSQPNGLTISPTGAGEGHSVYGTGWHFHRWLGDTYADAVTPQGDAPLFLALTDSLAGQGTAGLFEQTGKTFPQLMEEFLRTILLHATGAPEGQRAFTSYDFVSATDVLANQPQGEYPWPVTTSSSGITKSFASAKYEGPLGPAGVRIHDFVSSGTGTGAQINVSVDGSARILVVRIR